MKRVFLLAAVSLLFSASVLTGSQAYTILQGSSALSQAPEVRLIKPVQEEVVLSGEKELEFKWSPHEGSLSDRQYYDFRLYKGYDMVESNLILKKRIPHNTYQVSLNADLFEDGRIYTWSLRQVYNDSRKGIRSYQSFKVVKK